MYNRRSQCGCFGFVSGVYVMNYDPEKVIDKQHQWLKSRDLSLSYLPRLIFSSEINFMDGFTAEAVTTYVPLALDHMAHLDVTLTLADRLAILRDNCGSMSHESFVELCRHIGGAEEVDMATRAYLASYGDCPDPEHREDWDLNFLTRERLDSVNRVRESFGLLALASYDPCVVRSLARAIECLGEPFVAQAETAIGSFGWDNHAFRALASAYGIGSWP